MRHDIVEDMVVREFKDLCSTCFHVDSCAYSKKEPDKLVIQCEMFEVGGEDLSRENIPEGLCKTCDVATHCRLPGKKLGAWHCNEFQ